MRNHTDLLNLIAKKINAQWYCELGVFNPDHNFNHIKVKNKISVDPDPKAGAIIRMTSDDFFKMNKLRFQLGFVDGLHHAEQVKKDIINLWECLDDYGVIVVHDTNPHSEDITYIPRDRGEWCGNCYVAISQLISSKVTLEFDYGCTIIVKYPDEKLKWSDKEITWEYFDKNKKRLLGLVSVEEGLKYIDSLSKEAVNV